MPHADERQDDVYDKEQDNDLLQTHGAGMIDPLSGHAVQGLKRSESLLDVLAKFLKAKTL